MTPTQQRNLRDYLREHPGDPVRSGAAEKKHLWGPRDLPFFRDAFYAHTRLSKVLDEPRFQVPEPQDAATWEMYFGTRDFADVHQEMRQDFEFNHTYLHGAVAGLLDNAGERGNLVVAFDPFHLPVIAVTAKADYTFAGQDPKTPDWEADTSMAKHPTDSRLILAKVKALSLQWWVEPNAEGNDGTFACFSQMLTPGGTWRTSPWGNQSSAEAILIAFMLVSRDLRMLERTESTVQGSPIPPKVKAQVKRRDRLSTVTVVNLRKPMRDQLADVREASATGRHLQHRSVVRGFWRMQPVGPGRTQRRLTYIAPYVRGPKGAPFLHQDKVLKW